MDRLNGGSALHIGDVLTSPNGRYALKMQADGNVVLYEDGAKPIWATNTQHKDAERLEMQDDGNLVVYANGKDDLWRSRTSRNKGASLVLQDDGNLVIYSSDKKSLWASDTISKTSPAPAAAPAATTTTPAAAATTAMDARLAKAGNAPASPGAKPAVAANVGAAAATAVTAAAAKTGNKRTYTVAKGDSLWKIAEKIYGSGTDYKKIAQANNISNPDLIRPGQQLVIPE